MMAEVHAPYHFVPLSKWVYMPDWAHLVSHDVPFEDGVSGVIEYTLTNHTPLCVGDTQDKNGILKFARNPKGELVIPSSSLKGMIRSVLEIASFGKLSQVDDKHFAYRDFQDTKYKSWVENNQERQAGWIKYDAELRQWTFRKAKHTVLFLDEFRQALKNRISTSRHGSHGYEKYEQFPLSKTFQFNLKPREFVYETSNAQSQTVQRAKIDRNGQCVGHAIFSSFRPSIYPMSADKKNVKLKRYQLEKSDLQVCTQRTEFSYAFYDVDDCPFAPNNFNHVVAQLFESHEPKQVEMMKRHAHPEYGIPVFAKANGQVVSALGFSKLPKIKYNNSVHGLIHSATEAHLSNSYFDMAELIFGTLRDKELSLKSRVHFSDATCLSKPDMLQTPNVVLSEPRATFYPNYIEQSKKGALSNYNHPDATPSGVKRYVSKSPKHDNLSEFKATDKQDKVSHRFELCARNACFQGQIVFHNLKPVELSALLWSLELQGNYHQIGHGKPFGAGAIKIAPTVTRVKANNGRDITNNDIDPALFESSMNRHYPNHDEQGWKTSPQITYLLETANLEANQDVDTRYMSLDDKEFQDAKKDNKALASLRSLPRAERLTNAATSVSLSFGRGRLNRLFDKTSEFDSKLLEQQQQKLEALKKEHEEKQQQELEQQKRDAMSTHELKLHDLTINLERVDQTERPPLLREAITFFLENADNSERGMALQLYTMARKYDFHQKPKRRAKEQKARLAELKELYGLDV
ncbi:TIGR03986 family CRISPR-associated RAMP protein [Vibrio sp. MarTm2]|nr:TIGR03986 family CRISPR-associated RAMP protein [Vibrio sp. MarTm2]